MQVLNLTPEQINSLPPAEREQIHQLVSTLRCHLPGQFRELKNIVHSENNSACQYKRCPTFFRHVNSSEVF